MARRRRAATLPLDGVDAAYRVPVVLVVVVGRIGVGRVEVQVVGVVAIVHRRGPVVPVRTTIVRIRAIPVPGENKASSLALELLQLTIVIRSQHQPQRYNS